MSQCFRLARTLIRVSGHDAHGFLNNLLTQTVDKLPQAGVLYAGLLTPQGKVICDMLLWEDAGAVIIDADASRGGDLLRRLQLYKLRAAVEIEDVSAARIALWGPAAFEAARPDPRRPEGDLGWRALAVRSAAADAGAGFDAMRIAAGAPDLARDAAPEEVFALEALFEELNGVDFHKGCFVGQENVSRMKRRATTRKKFCPLVFAGDAPPFGAQVLAGEAELGTVRTSAGERALALVRLDRALSAVREGQELTADGRVARLDPPAWLLLPEFE